MNIFQAIPDEVIVTLLPLFSSPMESVSVLMILQSLSKPRPESLLPAVDSLFSTAQTRPDLVPIICAILGDIALYNKVIFYIVLQTSSLKPKSQPELKFIEEKCSCRHI